jgi:hypothetical protein
MQPSSLFDILPHRRAEPASIFVPHSGSVAAGMVRARQERLASLLLARATASKVLLPAVIAWVGVNRP